MRPASSTLALVGSRVAQWSPRRATVRRLLVRLILLGWILAGLIGAYSYLENYYLHRGFATPARLARAGAGRLFTVHFYSSALDRRTDYLVYLPADYGPPRRYPVFYLLHGLPGRPLAFTVIGNIEVRLENLISQRRMAPMILVFPDGRINGSQFSDSEWANTPSGRFESYVLGVVQDVDRRFATLPRRQDRVIAGLSAGAYGAINITLHHLGVFASAQVWSGYFTQTRSGVFAHATKAELAYNSPIDYVRTLRARLAADPLRAFLFVGRGDSASRQIVPMARALKAQGANISYAIYPGGHDWQLWNARLDQMLVLASRDVGQPLHHPGRRRQLPGARAERRAHRASLRHHQRVHRWQRAHRRRRAQSIVPGGRGSQRTGTGSLGTGQLLVGLVLALASAAAINLGFLLQHRGLRNNRSPVSGHAALLRTALRSRSWVGGQALGWAGFVAQILAVSIAPLTLVQSFAAGGLALSVPLAAGLFGHRISRAQLSAVLLAAAGLAALPIALPSTTERLHTELLIASVAVALTLAIPFGLARAAVSRAIAAGLLYGIADAAIKAVSVGWTDHGSSALISGWTMLALLGTFGGFLAFQAALRAGNAVTTISLMNALAAVVALGCGLLGFGESLGRGPGVTVAHLLALTLVLACVPVLATAEKDITDTTEADNRKSSHPGPPVGTAFAAAYRTGQHSPGGEQQRLQPRADTR